MSSLPTLNNLYEHAACGLLLTDTQGQILQANQTFCNWLGYSSDELVGALRIQELFTMGGRFFHQTHWAPLLEMQKSVAEILMDIKCKSGKTVPVLINALRSEHNGKAYNELAFFIATDRKKYEQQIVLARQNSDASLKKLSEVQVQLQESRDALTVLNDQLSISDRRKDEFLATLAHELRNPLAPIRNVLEVLKLKKIEDPLVKWAKDIIERQVKQMTHLVDDLMEISRITKGKLELRKTNVLLNEVLKNAVDVVSAQMTASHHRFTVNIPDEEIFVHGDDTRLTQIVTNLLTNAAKYTPDGGSVTLSVSSNRHIVTIEVLDTGIGIAQESLNSVFEMFSQLTPALQRAQGGLGIGLALVRGLVDLHDGNIYAESNGEGCGTRFVVNLPLADKAQLECATQELQSSGAHNNLKVLIVDDNVDAAISLAAALEMLGYTSRSVHAGITGLELAEAFKPDIILLDIGLPDITGYEVARRLRSTPWGKDIYLVAVTGWAQTKDKALAKEAGFDHHFTKPLNFIELDQLIKTR